MASEQLKKSARPKVGVAVIVQRGSTILLGKRKSQHAYGYFAPPGGHLEFGETFEQCALRELEEETGILATKADQLAVFNTIYYREEKHYVVVFMLLKMPEGQEPQVMEPDKCSGWEFYNLDQLPSPLMPGFKMLIDERII